MHVVVVNWKKAKSKDKRKFERQTDEVRTSKNDRRRSKRNGDDGTTIQLLMLPSFYYD
jgi:hypothetical protein